MVVEARFPRYALVSGSFDREDAEAARRWAKGILARSIALPVRVDAWRLVERLGAHFRGEALMRAVDERYLAPASSRDAALLALFGRAEAEPWLAAKLREHATPGEAGALRLAAAYVDGTGDPGRLLGLACVDPRGPRWPPETFVAALAALADPRRAAVRPRAFEAALSEALAAVFGEDAPRLRAIFRAGVGGAAGVPAVRATDETAAVRASIDALAALGSPGELDAGERERIKRLALAVGEVRRRVEDHGGAVSTGAARRTVAGLLARGGPTLTEDAWDWIDREEDPDLCAFLAGLATLEPADAETAALRRALLENRALCRYAAAAARAL